MFRSSATYFRMILSYKDNVVTFEFAVLNYYNTFKNQYAYRLEGFSDTWIRLGSDHRATLTNLDGGRYTLRVRRSDNDGVWNEEGAVSAGEKSPRRSILSERRTRSGPG